MAAGRNQSLPFPPLRRDSQIRIKGGKDMLESRFMMCLLKILRWLWKPA
jgi:hypothetical protein